MGMQDMSWGTPRFTTLVDNGDPARRLDIALIGDGYTARQQTTFRRDAAAVVDEFRGTEPIKTYFQHLNFHRIDVISAESGADDMHASPAITRRTALDTYFSTRATTASTTASPRSPRRRDSPSNRPPCAPGPPSPPSRRMRPRRQPGASGRGPRPAGGRARPLPGRRRR